MIDTPREVVSNPLNALRREFLSCARHSALFMHVLALALGVFVVRSALEHREPWKRCVGGGTSLICRCLRLTDFVWNSGKFRFVREKNEFASTFVMAFKISVGQGFG